MRHLGHKISLSVLLTSHLAIAETEVSREKLTVTANERLEGKVDIRAVGDTAYVGEWDLAAIDGSPISQGLAPDGYIEKRLNGMLSLRSPHINIMNLEASITRSCTKFSDKTFSFAVRPESVAEFAKWGFNMIALANNHSLDCLEPGIRREIRASLAYIRNAAPRTVFHGVSYRAEKLKDIATQTIQGVRIGMVSLKGWAVGARQPIGNISNRKEIFKALKDAPVDIRILSYHGGIEKSRVPTDDNRKVLQEFIADYDGDVVFAHHPHVTQGIELLKKPNGRLAVIFHSLGNFFHDKLSTDQDGMLARIEVTKEGLLPWSTQIYPLRQETQRPAPINAQQLPRKLKIIQSSTNAIQKLPIKDTLVRIPFEFIQSYEPIPVLGLKQAN